MNSNELAFELIAVFIAIPAMLGYLFVEIADLIRFSKLSKHDQFREIMMDDRGELILD